MRTGAFISKSKFLWGLQCPKLLWHAYNAKHLIPEPDTQQQAACDDFTQLGGECIQQIDLSAGQNTS